MSTFTYKNYTLNGYLNTPNYDTEVALFKAILDQLPVNGTTYVTTEHHHSRISSPTSDVSALTVNESGIVNLPLLGSSRGVLVKNAAGDIGVTTGVLGYIESPGTGRILYGASTGLANDPYFTFASNRLTVVGSTGAIAIGARVADDGYPRTWLSSDHIGLGDGTSVVPKGKIIFEDDAVAVIVNGVTGLVVDALKVYTNDIKTYNAACTGMDGKTSNCFYMGLGEVVDYWITISATTGMGTAVRVALPIPASSALHNADYRWLLRTSEDVTVRIGSAKLDTGATGIWVFADAAAESGINGWYAAGVANTRSITGSLRYYKA